MTDVLTVKQRSENMSRIKGKNTQPELAFRKLLIEHGIDNFTAHPKYINGRPDFYFPSAGTAVFIDGCFWHKCPRCFKAPRSNIEFWSKKIKQNVLRDVQVNKALSEQGIIPVRFWEHEIESAPLECVQKIRRMVTPEKKAGPKVLDLFAGVGGLSEGFVKAGCEIVGHIEMDKDASCTLETRVLYHALKERDAVDDYRKYLLGRIKKDEIIEKHNLYWAKASVIQAKIGKENYAELIKRIQGRLNGSDLDIIVGGPPCQAYSYIGRSSDRKKMKRDPRNYLYHYYIKFLKAFKPKIFVFENVPGLLTAGGGRYLKHMRTLMKKAGYTTDYHVLNAADYGVPQNRKRIILVGWNHRSGLKGYPEFKPVKRDYLVRDFLSGLPKLRPGQGKAAEEYTETSSLLKKLGISDPEFNLLLDHTTRPHGEKDLKIYRLAAEKLKKGVRLKYNLLPQNLKTHKNETSFLDRFRVVDFSSAASHTVIAHIGRDGHYYIHPDLHQNRSLSVREAARLQTFPDDFKFEGSRNSAFRQIGNAVPPMLSSIIARELIKYL